MESQLISDPNPNMPKPLELEKSIPFFDELKITKCKHCNTPFSRYDPIIHYQHPSGWIVPGYEKKQWLYIECPGCQYQWSLWKLGVGKSLLPIQHKNKELQTVWTDKSHPGALENKNLLLRDKSELEKEFQTLLIDKCNLQSEIANLKLEKDELQKEIQNLKSN